MDAEVGGVGRGGAGFTLIEMLVTLAVLAVVLGVTALSLSSRSGADESAACGRLQSFVAAALAQARGGEADRLTFEVAPNELRARLSRSGTPLSAETPPLPLPRTMTAQSALIGQSGIVSGEVALRGHSLSCRTQTTGLGDVEVVRE